MKYSGKSQVKKLRDSSEVQGFEGIGPRPALGNVLQPLGMNDRLEIEQGAFENLIDYNEIEFFGLRHLNGGVLHAQIDDLGRVLTAPL
jgi:hypothetical protein